MNEAPVLLDIDLIVANPYQVRQAEDPVAVAELAANIEKNGLLQPPTVRPGPCLEEEKGMYQLAFGHTRLAAFKLLASGKNNLTAQHKDEYKQMPCFIRDLDDLQMFEFAVAENIKRRDLNPIERARAMQTYMDKFKKTSAETGEFFGCDEATVRGTVRLLGLPEVAQTSLSSGEITIGTARQLLILARVAPDTVEQAVKRVTDNEPVDKVVSGILDGLAYKNKAIKMQASWASGKPSAGPGLWELDMPTEKIAKFMQPLSGLDGIDIRLAKKALPGGDFSGISRPRVEDWVNKLHSGLVSAEALIAQGADAETVERLDQLIHPPACTVCPFYVKTKGNHYCTWKVCHSRKKDAWAFVQLAVKEKSLEIKPLSQEEARTGFVVLDSSWNKAQAALIEKKDSNLRLHIKPAQSTHAFTGSEVVEVVTISPEAVQAKKEEKKTDPYSSIAQVERQQQYKRERELAEASHKFEENEIDPLFATLLDGVDSLGFLMEMANMDDKHFDRDPGGKVPSRKEKLRLCRIGIIHDLLENMMYDVEDEGPVATAEFIKGVAKTWGVDLPKDWLEKAKSYEPESVAVETEPGPEVEPGVEDEESEEDE